jgi:hypothetical protein
MDLQHIRRYERPPYFADFSGIDRAEYFVAYGRHRDSDTLRESNYRTILAQLGGESETVIVLRDSHFAMGWVETILIHESDTAALETVDQILAGLEDYPVVCEDDWSSLEYERAAEYWARASVRERLEWCQRYDVSPFAARRNEVPEDPRGELISRLAE